MLLSNFCQQLRFRSMLRQTEVKVFRDVLKAPKLPPNSYALYYQQRFHVLKSQNPSAPITEVGKTIASEWKSKKPEEKAPFELKANEERGKYKEIRSKYVESLTPGHKLIETLLKYNGKEIYNEDREREVRKSLRQFRANFPEGPTTPRGIFLKEKLSGKKFGEDSSALSAWAALPSHEKALYEEKARKEAESYRAAITAFLSNPSSNYN